MVLVAADRFDEAVYLLALAIVLDLLDGRVARRLRATSEFGRQLDSFSDAGSFGIAPAFLVYHANLQGLKSAGVLVAIVYLLAGMFRLGRHNLLSDVHAKARRTMGLPIPIGASYLMAVVLLRDSIPPAAAAGVVLLMACAMVTRWKLPELRGSGAVTAMLGVGIANYLAFLAWPGWYTAGWWTLWNLAIVAAARTEDRRLGLDPSTEP